MAAIKKEVVEGLRKRISELENAVRLFNPNHPILTLHTEEVK